MVIMRARKKEKVQTYNLSCTSRSFSVQAIRCNSDNPDLSRGYMCEWRQNMFQNCRRDRKKLRVAHVARDRIFCDLRKYSRRTLLWLNLFDIFLLVASNSAAYGHLRIFMTGHSKARCVTISSKNSHTATLCNETNEYCKRHFRCFLQF